MKRKQRRELVLIILLPNCSTAQRADAGCFAFHNSAKDVPKTRRGNGEHGGDGGSTCRDAERGEQESEHLARGWCHPVLQQFKGFS